MVILEKHAVQRNNKYTDMKRLAIVAQPSGQTVHCKQNNSTPFTMHNKDRDLSNCLYEAVRKP